MWVSAADVDVGYMGGAPARQPGCIAATVESLSELSVGEFGDDVEVAKMARILLNQVEWNKMRSSVAGSAPSQRGPGLPTSSRS